MASAATTPKLRILMLHGYTNTGAIFRSKTRALEKSIQKAFPQSTLLYLDGPLRLKPSDIPSYPGVSTDPRSQEQDDVEIDSFAWWRRRDPPAGSSEPVVYAGIDQGLSRIAEAIREHGPFDGVVGFSQGASAAAITASLLEGEKRRDAMNAAKEKRPFSMNYPDQILGGTGGKHFVQNPLKFAVLYSGFAAPPDVYGAIYEPKIETPTLHVIGSYDTIVSEEWSQTLVGHCVDPKIFVHPGGHFCPSTKDALEQVVSFIKAAVLGNEGPAPKRGLGDDNVEDMDMPF